MSKKKKISHKKDKKHLEEFGTLDLGLQASIFPKRQSTALSQTELPEKEDDLAFAKGCLAGLIIAIPMWAMIIGAIKMAFFK